MRLRKAQRGQDFPRVICQTLPCFRELLSIHPHSPLRLRMALNRGDLLGYFDLPAAFSATMRNTALSFHSWQCPAMGVNDIFASDFGFSVLLR
jgi:hypothetical protein